LSAWACGLRAATPLFPLKVSENHRYLVDAEGKLFFLMGDTPWFLQKLPLDDVRRILQDLKGRVSTRCFSKSSMTAPCLLATLAGKTTARWFDPTSGEFKPIENPPTSGQSKRDFTPPAKNAAGDHDWVLVLETR